MFDLFQLDFPVGQGVLLVDAMYLDSYSPQQLLSDQIYTPQVLPGDVNIPKPPK